MSSMRPCKTKLRFFADEDNAMFGKLSPDVLSGDLEKLLAANSLLFCYCQNSTVTVNNMLWGAARDVYSPYFDPDKPPNECLISWKRLRRRVEKTIKKGGIYFLNWLYPPISLGYVKDIIEIDEVFRASKAYSGPQTVYRGTVAEENLDLNCLVSTTTDFDVAGAFCKGSILKMELPAGFPRIDMTAVSSYRPNGLYGYYSYENEILLPPCDFEVFERTRGSRGDLFPNLETDILTVRLTPKNLAKTLLENIENLPKGYSQEFRANPKYEFEKAHALLKSYVENYVNKGLIKIGTSVFHEKDIDFEPASENDQPTN